MREGTKPSVLVVEDEAELLEELVELFKLRGMVSFGAASVDEALDNLTGISGPIVVITDLNLPRRSGLDLLSLLGNSPELRERISRFILMTGHTDLDEGSRAAVERCRAAILPKPVHVRELLPLVEAPVPVDWGSVEDGIQYGGERDTRF